MYIQRIKIQNLKGFRDLDFNLKRSDGRFEGWTVIAGRNGSGKSTFLKAVALALSGPTNSARLVESFSGWIRQGETSGQWGVVLKRHPGDTFGEASRPSEQPLACSMSLDQDSTLPVQSPTLGGKNFETRWAKNGPWSELSRGWFLAAYGPFRRISGHAPDAMRLMVGPERISRSVSLFREDSSLVESIQWLKDIHLRSLEKREGWEELKISVIRLMNDGLLPDGMRVERIDADGLWATQGGLTLPLGELSDGYRVVTALVMDLLRQLHRCYGSLNLQETNGVWAVDQPGVVLIDEVDLHLHLSWQKKIGFWLKHHFPRIQFIVATHSPFVCQAADLGGLFKLPGLLETNMKPSPVSEDVFRQVVMGTSDDAILTELFGLDSTLSDEAKGLRLELANLEAALYRGDLDQQGSLRLKELQQLLPMTLGEDVAKAYARTNPEP